MIGVHNLPGGSQWCLLSQSQTRRLDLAFQQQLEIRLPQWGSCKCFLHLGDDQIVVFAYAFCRQGAKELSDMERGG